MKHAATNALILFVALALAAETVVHGLQPAWLKTLQTIDIRQKADAAETLQRGVALKAYQDAITKREEARNAAVRFKGEAEVMIAEADKSEAEARTAAETARNAEQKFASAAAATSYQARIKMEEARIELEKAKLAVSRESTAARKAEAEANGNAQRLYYLLQAYSKLGCPGGDDLLLKAETALKGKC